MSIEKNTQTNGEAKVLEYIRRIQSGVPKNEVLNGLPQSFVEAIEKGLNSQTETLSKSEAAEPEHRVDDSVLASQKAARVEEDAQMLTDIRRRLGIDEVSEQINYDQLTPEQVLLQLATYCEPYMSAPLEAVQDGTFAGVSKLKIEKGCVVLVRHASDEVHLIKSGKSASSRNMSDSSLFSGGAHESGAVHTSADVDHWGSQYSRYPIYGEFRIPVKDFLELGKQGKLIIGNLGEAEIVLSGDVAQKYLSKVTVKNHP